MNKFVLIWFLASFVAFGQEATVVPQPPFVQFPTGSAAWSIDIKTPPRVNVRSPTSDQTPPQPEVTSVDVTVVGKIRRDVLHWNDNHNTETWIYNDFLMTENPSGKWINVSSAKYGSDAMKFHLQNDLAGFDWLSMQNYLDVVNIQKVKCFHFKEAESSDKSRTSELREAWIDANTRLPVALRRGQNQYLFKFKAPSGDTLSLPPRFQKEYEKLLKYGGR